MLNSRKKMLDKVKAILSKTMENGCTEEEAMTALAKARELMATYEIDEAELNAAEQEKVAIFRTSPSDPYDIKANLAQHVGKFTRCVGWGGKVSDISFCGLESDVIFATWLLETLQLFVMRALRDYQKQRSLKKMTNSNYTSASFVMGCVGRIVQKLKQLTPEREVNALVIAELAKNGIKLKKFKNTREAHMSSIRAGHKAGDSARFDRPVGSGGTLRLK